MARPATAAVRLLTGEREPVRLATTGPIDVDQGGLLIIDGVQTAVGDRVLVKDQTDASENGIRTVSAAQWYRAADARTARTLQKGTTVHVAEGSTNAGKTYVFNTLNPVIGDTAISIVFYQSDDGIGIINAAIAAGLSAISAALSTISLPNPAVASTYLKRNSGNTSYDALTPEQVATDLPFKGAFASPAVRTSRSKMQDRADLRDWNGLDLSGVNDNASLMNAALTATGAESMPLYVPSGDIALGSMVSVPASASIIGTGPIGTIYQGDTLTNQKRTKFHIGHTGKGFQAFGAGTRSFKGFTTYRDHAAPGVGWTPTAHDFDFDITDAAADIYFDEIVLLNPYKGIQTRRGAVRVHFNRVRGQPLFSGIEIHQAYDVMWGDQIGFWPFWSNDTNVRQWMRTNGVAFRFFRVDNPKLGVMFGIGYHFTMELGFDADGGAGLPAGSLSKGYINTLGGDSAAGVIHTTTDSVSVGLVIDKCYGHSGLAGDWTTNDHLIHDQGTNNRLSFGHLELGLQSSGSRLIAMRGTGGKLRASRAEFYRWDESVVNNSALLVNSGNQITIDDYLAGSASPGSTAPIAAHNAAGGVLEVPTWLAYTPTIAAVSGTITTLGTLTNRYQRRRNLLKLSIDVTVTTIGTATGGMTVSLPMSLTAVSVASGIWRNTATGATGVITALAGSGVVTFSGFPVADGQRVIGSIEIELA